MTRALLKMLAESMTTENWPGIRDKYLAEQADGKTLEERVKELEEALLLLSIGFLRVEKVVSGLASFAERVKAAMWGKL